jgi:hypothetical protein
MIVMQQERKELLKRLQIHYYSKQLWNGWEHRIGVTKKFRDVVEVVLNQEMDKNFSKENQESAPTW